MRTSTSGLAALVLLPAKLEQTVFILTVGGLTLVAMLLFAVWKMPYERLEWVCQVLRPGSAVGE